MVPFRGQRLPLAGGSALAFTASRAEPLELRIALPPGTRVENLQPQGQDQPVLDLLPPAARRPGAGGAELSVIPPVPGLTPQASGAAGPQVVFQEPAKPPKRLSPPEAQFTLPLAGAARLRLERSEPTTPVVFEPNIHVSEVQFTTQRQSLFDQSPLSFSTLRSGTLHLGRLEPLSLRADQFLRIEPPGIAVLTSLRAQQTPSGGSGGRNASGPQRPQSTAPHHGAAGDPAQPPPFTRSDQRLLWLSRWCDQQPGDHLVQGELSESARVASAPCANLTPLCTPHPAVSWASSSAHG